MNGESWQVELQILLDRHNQIKLKGKVVSKKTRTDRSDFLFAFFRELRKNGFAVQPQNINQKHIKFICNEYEKRNLTAATNQTYMMHLRAFCQWIGKAGMIDDLSKFFSDEIFYRRADKAPTQIVKVLEPEEINSVFKKLREREPVVYLQLLIQVAFDLTRKEVVHLRPLMNVINDTLHVVDGTRGKVIKAIPIETDFQKDAIRQAKAYVQMTSKTLTIQGKTVKQSITHQRNVMTRYGITKKTLGISGHGLKAAFSEIPNFFNDGEKA